GKLTGDAARTAASLTRSAWGPGGGGRGRLPRLELLLQRLDLPLDVRHERIGRVLDQELLVHLDLQRDVPVRPGRVRGGEERARVAGRQLREAAVDADVLLDRLAQERPALRLLTGLPPGRAAPGRRQGRERSPERPGRRTRAAPAER